MTPLRPRVVGFGELVWDVFPHATLAGGAPANFVANFVWHAQPLGAQGTLISAVGRAADGDALVDWLHEMGLDSSAVQRDVRSIATTIWRLSPVARTASASAHSHNGRPFRATRFTDFSAPRGPIACACST